MSKSPQWIIDQAAATRGDTQHDRAIVLKIGGSILTGEADIAAAVHEIYSWVRRGWRVIAVVSALHGATDRLLARAAKYGQSPNESAVATLVATGELTSASLIGLALDRSGVPAEVLDAAAIGLRSEGSRLDGALTGVDVGAVRATLARVPVLVVPGFIARDEQGHTTLLGRGGSDLTALFLAHRLCARCRLIKDVPGVFEHDPKAGGARRYARLSWDDLAAIGGKVVQPKTAAFAREHRVTFEVGAILRSEATVVGPGESRLAELSRGQSRPIRVALLGHGTVGAGVARAIRRQPERFRLAAVAVRNPDKPGHAAIPRRLITTDAIVAATGDADVVVEAIGGIEPARSLIEAALLAGKHVVSANKAVLAAHGQELSRLAEIRGVRLSYSAAVGGSVPVIEAVRDAVERGIGVSSIQAVLNGTTNFVLERTGEGATFEGAITEAQDLGFAEADPTRDLSGQDASDKIALLAREAWGSDPESVNRVPVTHAPAPSEGRVKQVATLTRDDVRIRATVRPEVIPDSHPLTAVRRECNGALIQFDDGMSRFISGKGAGRWPTTEAVVADLLDTHRAIAESEARIPAVEAA